MSRKKGLTIPKFRSVGYKVLKYTGDVNALMKGKICRRIGRRILGRITGKVMGKIFR